MNLIKLFRTVLFLTTVVLPAAAILFLGFLVDDFYWNNTPFEYAMQWTFLLYTMPIFAIYNGTIFLRFTPHNTTDVILSLLPPLLSIVIVFGQAGSIWNSGLQILAQAIPFYLGLSLCFMGGLKFLIYKNRSDLTPQRALSMLAIILPYMATIVYFGALGHYLFQEFSFGPTPFLTTSLFAGQILMITGIYFPKLIVLYNEGKL